MALLKPRRTDLPVYDDRLFDSLIRRGFAQRRKQLRKAMPENREWNEVCAELGISETVRAEELSLEQWIDLTRLYDSHPLRDVAQKDDEMLDVVDAKDEVLRSEKRVTIHSENLLHRAVHILVFNKRRELFLQKRSRLKDKCPGLWDSSAAGHVDSGEGYLETAVRELDEELGVQLPSEAFKEVAVLSPCENTGWEFIRTYIVRYDGAVRYPCSEVETGEWFDLETAKKWITSRPEDFAPGFVECWNAVEELIT